MDAGEETIADPALAERLRSKATRIHRRSLAVAAAVTVVVLAFP